MFGAEDMSLNLLYHSELGLTGGDGYNVPDLICDVYFGGNYPCFGGIMALNGKHGEKIWTTFTKHEVFALNCNADLDMDDISDCVAGGRAGVRK